MSIKPIIISLGSMTCIFGQAVGLNRPKSLYLAILVYFQYVLRVMEQHFQKILVTILMDTTTKWSKMCTIQHYVWTIVWPNPHLPVGLLNLIVCGEFVSSRAIPSALSPWRIIRIQNIPSTRETVRLAYRNYM